jgi:class 3 adenylate cyclase
MSISKKQMPQRFIDIIENEKNIFEKETTVIDVESIPDTSEIPISDPKTWLRVPDVICVYVDMKNSTMLSANAYPKSTANAYQLFTGTAVRLFDEFDSPYIDVKGDGVFALFDSNKPYTALAAAVTFKTFSNKIFVPLVGEKNQIDVGAHIGIDQKSVLVKKIGLKKIEGRTDRQNEVWAGKTVNMAAKLAGLGENDELIISDRFAENLTDDWVLKSCGCPNGEKVDIWHSVDLSENEMFDFDLAYKLKTQWCTEHGKEYCEYLLSLDR